MKNHTVKVEERTEQFITLPEEFGFKEGDKFTIKLEKDGKIILIPYRTIEIDLEESVFLKLAQMAHEQDITFNELVGNILREIIENLNDKSYRQVLYRQTNQEKKTFIKKSRKRLDTKKKLKNDNS